MWLHNYTFAKNVGRVLSPPSPTSLRFRRLSKCLNLTLGIHVLRSTLWRSWYFSVETPRAPCRLNVALKWTNVEFTMNEWWMTCYKLYFPSCVWITSKTSFAFLHLHIYIFISTFLHLHIYIYIIHIYISTCTFTFLHLHFSIYHVYI
jgi:hypothetical protein